MWGWGRGGKEELRRPKLLLLLRSTVDGRREGWLS